MQLLWGFYKGIYKRLLERFLQGAGRVSRSMSRRTLLADDKVSGLWYLLGGLEDLVSKAITTVVRVISKYQYDCFLYNPKP